MRILSSGASLRLIHVGTRPSERCVFLTYTEPEGWECPPMHCADRAAAEARRDGINLLAGPSARERRTWTIRPCGCGGEAP